MRNDPAALREHVREILADEGSPDILKLALESLGENIAPADGPLLRAVYEDFDAGGPKRDPGGDVRIEVLRALWHLRSSDDRALALRARNTSERTLQSNGEMIRAAGLALLGVLDPERAAIEAVLVLGRDDGDVARAASKMTGEPALTAVRLLANLGETRALLLYALSGDAPTGDVIAEALRGLTSLGTEVLEPMLATLANSDDDALLMAACDVITELPPGQAVNRIAQQMLRSPSRGEVFAFMATSIVASRRDDLVSVLIAVLPEEMSQKRLRAAHDALELAPKTPVVEAALNELQRRLAKQAPPARD